MSTRARWIVVACLVCQLGLGTGYVLSTLAREVIADLGWTRAMFSSGRAPQIWVIGLVTPFVGLLLARFGARALLSAAVVVIALAFWLLGEIQNVWHLTAISMLFGLALAGVGDVAVGAVLSQWVQRRRGFVLGIAYTGSNLAGAVLNPFAAFLLAQGLSWRDAFHSIGLLALVVMLPFALFVIREPRRDERVVPDGIDPAEAEGGAGGQVVGGAGDRAEGGAGDLDLRAALRTRSFWLLAFALLCFWFYFLGLLGHLVLFLEDVGFEKQEAAGYFSFALLVGLFSKVSFGFVADRLKPRTGMLINTGLVAVSSFLLLALPNDRLLYPFLVVFGFSVAARDVIYPLVIAHCFGVRHLATIYGVLLVTLLPGPLGDVINGAIHDRYGSYDLAFAMLAALNVLALVALWFVRDERGGSDEGVRSPA